MSTTALQARYAALQAGTQPPANANDPVVVTSALTNALATRALVAFTSVPDANYTIKSTDRTVGLSTALTAPRTWTLPAASSFPAGTSLRIVDVIGGISTTNSLTITTNGTDTINGQSSHVFKSTNTDFQIVTDGTSKWTYDVQGLSRGGTGATTASAARTNLGSAASGANSDITSITGLTTPLSQAQGGLGNGTGDASGLSVLGRSLGGESRRPNKSARCTVWRETRHPCPSGRRNLGWIDRADGSWRLLRRWGCREGV